MVDSQNEFTRSGGQNLFPSSPSAEIQQLKVLLHLQMCSPEGRQGGLDLDWRRWLESTWVVDVRAQVLAHFSLKVFRTELWTMPDAVLVGPLGSLGVMAAQSVASSVGGKTWVSAPRHPGVCVLWCGMCGIFFPCRGASVQISWTCTPRNALVVVWS